MYNQSDKFNFFLLNILSLNTKYALFFISAVLHDNYRIIKRLYKTSVHNKHILLLVTLNRNELQPI